MLNRNIRVSDQRAYALVWTTPAGDWDSLRDNFDVVLESFQSAD